MPDKRPQGQNRQTGQTNNGGSLLLLALPAEFCHCGMRSLYHFDKWTGLRFGL